MQCPDKLRCRFRCASVLDVCLDILDAGSVQPINPRPSRVLATSRGQASRRQLVTLEAAVSETSSRASAQATPTRRPADPACDVLTGTNLGQAAHPCRLGAGVLAPVSPADPKPTLYVKPCLLTV